MHRVDLMKKLLCIIYINTHTANNFAPSKIFAYLSCSFFHINTAEIRPWHEGQISNSRWASADYIRFLGCIYLCTWTHSGLRTEGPKLQNQYTKFENQRFGFALDEVILETKKNMNSTTLLKTTQAFIWPRDGGWSGRGIIWLWDETNQQMYS